MIVSTCKISLKLFEVNSIKEKRMIIKSILDRVNAKFCSSGAEVAENEIWSKAILGFAIVSNEINHSQEIVEKIINFIDNDYRVEIISLKKDSIYIDD